MGQVDCSTFHNLTISDQSTANWRSTKMAKVKMMILSISACYVWDFWHKSKGMWWQRWPDFVDKSKWDNLTMTFSQSFDQSTAYWMDMKMLRWGQGFCQFHVWDNLKESIKRYELTFLWQWKSFLPALNFCWQFHGKDAHSYCLHLYQQRPLCCCAPSTNYQVTEDTPASNWQGTAPHI